MSLSNFPFGHIALRLTTVFDRGCRYGWCVTFVTALDAPPTPTRASALIGVGSNRKICASGTSVRGPRIDVPRRRYAPGDLKSGIEEPDVAVKRKGEPKCGLGDRENHAPVAARQSHRSHT
jgi:hypothetical protein